MGNFFLVKDSLSILLDLNNITKNELAKKTKIPGEQIDLILSGKNSNPSLDVLEKISDYIGVGVEMLSGNEEISGAEKLIFSTRPKNTAEVLKHLMLLLRESESSLGKASGVSHPILHRILNEKGAEPSFKTLHALASYFNITIDQLTGREEINYSRLEDSFFTSVPIINPSILSQIDTYKDLVKEWNQTLLVFNAKKSDFCIEMACENYAPLFLKGDKLVFERVDHNEMKNKNIVVATLLTSGSNSKDQLELYEYKQKQDGFIFLNSRNKLPIKRQSLRIYGKLYKTVSRKKGL